MDEEEFEVVEPVDEWNIWRIKNPFIRIPIAWLIVIFLIPVAIATSFVVDLIHAMQCVGKGKRGALDLFLIDFKYIFSQETWGEVWHGMTSLERRKR